MTRIALTSWLLFPRLPAQAPHICSMQLATLIIKFPPPPMKSRSVLKLTQLMMLALGVHLAMSSHAEMDLHDGFHLEACKLVGRMDTLCP